ncbi:hypothetical protein Tco_0624500 [Tanacetum coccineum]|uniref:Uncharacterized protein n=1 Tax=Tanacetum coccineum TaxID=301880 RepID=A0ABQ4WE32_9ASTR
MSSMKFGMIYDNTNGDSHSNEYELEVQGTIYIPDLVIARHVISLGQEAPTVVYEDNATCIAQLKDEYIKGDKTKHILPKFFFTHDLQKSGDIIVQKVRSSDKQADSFTKALPTTTFNKLAHDTGMQRLN